MEELKVIENELVPVYETDKGIKVVYGTELYKILGSKRQYTDWVRERLLDCDAEENKDFQSFSQKNEKGGRPKTEYIIQLSTAKEMAMLERNDKGKQVRRYFIAVEEKFKEVVQKGITHNVQRLTVTSRDIAIMANMKGKHSFVLNDIRECIAELTALGFDSEEFFTESTYITRVNNAAPQYLCTERGCERFSWRLEPREREIFIREFTDRFERMRAVLEGRPVKGVEFNEESQTVIRLYENNDWGILLMDNEVYNLTPKEVEMIGKLIPILKKKKVRDVKRSICAFLEIMERDGKLRELASWGVDSAEELEERDSQALLPPPQVDLNQVINLTTKQAQQRYGLSRTKILDAAGKAGAITKSGGRFYFNRKTMDEYFQNQY